MSYKKSFKSQRPSHGHSKNMFAEVRRKSYQKSFSLKINTPFLNTSNGGTDVCGGSSGHVPPHVVFVYSRLWYFLEKSFRVPKVVLF